jgi:hypothetical protein
MEKRYLLKLFFKWGGGDEERGESEFKYDIFNILRDYIGTTIK